MSTGKSGKESALGNLCMKIRELFKTLYYRLRDMEPMAEGIKEYSGTVTFKRYARLEIDEQN